MHSANTLILLTLVLYSCVLGLSQCYVNVALNKPAYQQNPFKQNDSTGDASNAVDGRKSDLSRNGGQCVVSAGSHTATWWVNLTSIHSIHNITIYYMTDNKPWGTSNDYAKSFFGFSVYVSNTTNKVNGLLCFKGDNFTLETIPAVITAICPVYGQYVIYYNERLYSVTYPENYYYAENNVCEVEVYGCPATGCYGSNNSFPCPDVNCRYCHKNTGTCQVCKPGYKGQRCELECETGKYGVNCSKSCGNCHNQSQCQNVDGSCSEGCSAGYMGSLCTEPCDQAFYGINCSQKCSANCSSQACHHVTGNCTDSSKTDEGSGDRVFFLAILGGLLILIRIVFSICFLYKKWKLKQEDKSGDVSPCRYDHSRVVLLNQASDYKNANFIDGLRQKDEYIATQGPKPHTVDDFSCMIWQENVLQIVMLTNLKEGTRKKCAKYWSDLNAENDSDDFIINTLEEKQYANYVIRKIQMTNTQQNETRTITQYHYIAWPDNGVPDPLCLLWFHDHVTRTKTYTHKDSTLVHCSAGIGRTGTYIAIDALYIEVKQDHKINIAEYVEKMRENRMNMVQTYEQYKTIFLTLYEMSMAPVTVQKPTEFIEKLETTKLDTPANVSSLRDEFQKLMSVRHQRRDDNDKMVSEGEGLSTTIRPRHENVIILNSSVSNRGSNIDGIFIHSFTNQNAFIVTHCQPADDVVDFLRLITEYDSEVVVFMDPLDRIESKDTWMPTTSTSSKSFPPFTIQLQQENTKENEWHKVEITKEDTDFKPRMVHFAAPTHDLTSDYAQTVSQILGLVSFAQNIMGEGPIIVVSKDGDALCGVFCAVYNLIQQLTMDKEIDVFSVVRLLQTRRPELCATMEEYEMINHAMMTFIQLRTDENTYYNE